MENQIGEMEDAPEEVYSYYKDRQSEQKRESYSVYLVILDVNL